MQDYNFQLDDEFLPFHDFLNYCRICFINIVQRADQNQLTKETINFKTADDAAAYAKICETQGVCKDEWLIQHGYKETLYKVYYKHLFFSLLVDFSNYFNASLDLAFHGNINVAWALLRKPFQETLAYIEWLYVDRDELLTLMLTSDKTDSYEIIRKKDKIRKHIERIYPPNPADPLNMYEFRYSYKDKLTLNGILQATNHLITSRPALKTSPSGLNFIFPDDEQRHRNIGFYYTSIPYVLKHTLDLVMTMFGDIAGLSDYTMLLNSINSTLKSLQMDSEYEDVKQLLSLDQISVFCPKCGHKHISDEMWIQFAYDHFECENCHHKISTHQFMFDFEEITFTTDTQN